MGTNYYLSRKVKYDPNIPIELGCGDGRDYIQELNNGFVYNNTYYKSIEDLNELLYQKIHIGKSSMGWHFLLAIYPDYNINSLSDWEKLFNDKNSIIEDEYGNVITPDDMLDRIVNRSQGNFENYKSTEEFEAAQLKQQNDFYDKYSIGQKASSYDELLSQNHAERGINGLWSHAEDEYTSHSGGTYDYIISGNDVNTGVIFS